MTPEPMPEMAKLAVFFGDQLVGHVFDSAPLSFTYSDAWLARPETAQIAAITPAAGPISSAAVTAFFENLLPEGELRHFIASSKKASTLTAHWAASCNTTCASSAPSPQTRNTRRKAAPVQQTVRS